MKKLKFLALLLPVFFAFFIVQNVEAKSVCTHYNFTKTGVTAYGDPDPNQKSSVSTPEICISNLDDNFNITADSELTKASSSSQNGWTWVDYEIVSGKKGVKVKCNSGDLFGKLYCSNNSTISLSDYVGKNFADFTNSIGNQMKSYFSNSSNNRENANGQVSIYAYEGSQNNYNSNGNPDGSSSSGGENGQTSGSTSGEDGENSENGEDGENGEEEDDNPDDNCYESGIDSMGWLVCPAIENTSNTIDAVEGLLRSWLEIDPGKVFQSGATDVAWGVFRNVANVLITIFLIVIIFSQITGYGIDNYGIKKALPRLIIVAILINFSFIICRLAVDISNILGVGLTDIFQNIANDINKDGVTATIATIVDALLALAVGAGASVGTVITIVSTISGGGVLIVISLLLTLLVALVAVLMFFVMLAARMLLVIFCTIISPVAFACYLLPNTQTFFKKWWDIFKASLVVFPICGALYGGSELIKAIVLSGNIDFFWALIGIAAPFLPFFALPALLKGALSGITAVGGAISAIGSGVRGSLTGANKAIQGTEAYKQQQRENDIKRTERSLAKLSKPGDEDVTKRELRDDLSPSKRRRAGVLRAQLDKYKDENSKMEQFSDDSKYAQYQAGKESKLWAQDVANVQSRARAGQEYMDNGEIVNTFDEKSTGDWHRENLDKVAEEDRKIEAANAALEQAKQNNDKAGISTAQNSLNQAQERRDAAMRKVEAAQNILTTSQGGREQVEKNISRMVASGDYSVAQSAASQIMREHAPTYKAASRGEFAKMANLAQAKDSNDFVAVAQKIADGSYDRTGINDYSAESLNAADDSTVETLAKQMENLSQEEQETLKGYARDALYGQNFKGKVSAKKQDAFRKILGDEAKSRTDGNNNNGQGGGIIIDNGSKFQEGRESGDIKLPR